MRPARFILPAVLIVVGAWLLAGCIYIPTFNATTEGKDISGKVGHAIRFGASSHEDVRKALGEPYFKTTDGHYWVYSWKKLGGFVIWPFCGLAGSESQAFAMTLEFDDSGTLRKSDLDTIRQSVGPLEQSVADAHRFVPPRVRDYEDLYQARRMFESDPKP